MIDIKTLSVKEIRELGRNGNHPNGWFLLETDALAYWVHLPHKDISNDQQTVGRISLSLSWWGLGPTPVHFCRRNCKVGIVLMEET